MQNRYVDDVGDFGKYGLQRYLVGARSSTSVADSLRLSVLWYLHPDESHNFDGKHTTYLRRTERNLRRFRQCDPDLYDVLEALIAARQRHISRIRNSAILPTDTNYYEESLSFSAEARRPAREEARDRWLHGALEVARHVDLVFVDPDNGIANRASPYAKKGPKCVFQEDLRQFIEQGQSLVVYHQLGRQAPADEQIRFWSERLRDYLGLGKSSWALRFRRGSARVYFVIPNARNDALLESRINSLLDSPWKSHFALV